MGDGTYRQDRRRITDSVLRVDPSKVPLPSVPSWEQEVRDYLDSKSTMLVSRNQGWVLAVLLAILALGFVFTTYTLFTRDHQAEVNKRDLRKVQKQIEELQAAFQHLERQSVEQEAQLKNLRESLQRP